MVNYTTHEFTDGVASPMGPPLKAKLVYTVSEKTPIGWYKLNSPHANEKPMHLLVSTDIWSEKKYGTLFREGHVPRTTLLEYHYLQEVVPCKDPLKT